MKGGRESQVFIALKMRCVLTAVPWHSPEEAAARVWVFLELCRVALSAWVCLVSSSQFGAQGERELESVCKLSNLPGRHEGLPFCVL